MKALNLKDLCFELDEEYGMKESVCGDLCEIEEDAQKALEAVSDDETRNSIDIETGRLCLAYQYKGFLLGVIAARKNSRAMNQIEKML